MRCEFNRPKIKQYCVGLAPILTAQCGGWYHYVIVEHTDDYAHAPHFRFSLLMTLRARDLNVDRFRRYSGPTINSIQYEWWWWVWCNNFF